MDARDRQLLGVAKPSVGAISWPIGMDRHAQVPFGTCFCGGKAVLEAMSGADYTTCTPRKSDAAQ